MHLKKTNFDFALFTAFQNTTIQQPQEVQFDLKEKQTQIV